ncbi:MAG TPA: lamin tail domain-containing protein [Gaiellaceae bacterium]
MKTILLAGAAAMLFVAAGVALAASAESEATPTVIYACKHPSGGWLRQVTGPAQCRRREQPVSWDIEGPKGEKGDPGAPGAAGAKGEKGDKGDRGDPGTVVTGLNTLEGVPCVAEDAAAGEIQVTISAGGNVALACIAAPDEPPPPPPPPPPAESAKLVINEVDYDQAGADANGFVEIHNTGGSAADLSNVDLVAVNGGDGAEYGREQLTGSLAAGGYLAVAIELQNGAPDGIALLDGTTLVDALSYEGPITAATIGGQTYNLVEGTMLAATVADSNTVDGSLIRNPDGKDTNDAASDWAFTTTLTRGAANVLTP